MASEPFNPGLDKWRLLEATREALRDPTFRFELGKMLAEHWTNTLPIEPIFDLDTVVRLVPLSSKHALRRWLKTYAKDWPKRYRLVGPEHRRHRMLYAHEVAQIRRHYLRGVV